MRKVKSVSSVLRVTGIILVILSMVLLIYATSNSGREWSEFRSILNRSNASVRIGDRFSFNHSYYMALRGALVVPDVATSTRSLDAASHFSGFLQNAEAGEQEALTQQAQELTNWFNNEFDTEAFLTKYNNQAGTQNAAEIREIFEYLDSLSTPPAKSGKALPKLSNTSSRPWFEEQYAQWMEQYGETVGSFFEYMLVMERLVKADGSVANATEFAQAISYEDYQTELAVLLAQEDRQDLVLFLDLFAAQVERKQADPQMDLTEFLHEEYLGLLDQFPESAQPSFAVFLSVVKDDISNLALYDGSYSMLVSGMRKAQTVLNDDSFAAFLRSFSRTLVESSESRRTLPLISLIWYLAANALVILLIGILLIISAKVLAKIATDSIIRKREYKAAQDDPDTLLSVNHLSQYFKSGDYINKAVDNISFHIKKGEVFGLVGESGCGKTTTGRTIINLYDPTDGDVYFKGLRISSTKNGAHLMAHQLRKELAKNIEGIKADAAERKKQEPSLAADIARESEARIAELRSEFKEAVKKVQYHAFQSEEEKRKCVMLYNDQHKAELLTAYEKDIQGLRGSALASRKKQYRADLAIANRDKVTTKIQMIFQDPIASINPRMTVREIIAEGLIIRGVKDKALIDRKVNEMLDLVGLLPEHASRYPHEFSGGQRQRIGIARAIVLEPELIIADEPISALDVSIQAQIINLMNDLRHRMGLTILFIAHNLSVVKYFSDRIAVMYYGKIVEMASSEELFLHPLHPYTKSLLSAIPYPDPHYEKQRKRVEYEPVLAHNYQTDKPDLHEITPGHFIHCNQEELLRYRQELKL